MGNVHYLRWPLRVAGAGLLAATAAIHLDLYLTGYRTIPVIGWLFLLQVIAAFALSLAVLVTPLLVRAARLPAAASQASHASEAATEAVSQAAPAASGAVFALATLGGYLLSLWVGLFGFREVRTMAGVVAGIIEIAAFAVLAVLTLISLPAILALRANPPGAAPPGAAPPSAAPPSAVPAGRNAPAGAAAIAGLTVAAVAVFAISVATANGASSNGPATASGHTLLRTASVNGVTVLTNSSGRTLYWFAPDTPSRSACYGSCASYWPPVYGIPSVAPGVTGVTGTMGTIHRTDGTIQATYDGHPLYTYIGDTAPGQASGNHINLNGGFWYEVRAA
jgi:predicted lipoprotein with Yx(FWY)xxD motif